MALPLAIPILDGAIKLGSQLIDRFIPDPQKKLQAEMEWTRIVQASELAQIAVNLQETKHESRFIAGWRPFVGWVCGSAFAYHFVLQPFLVFLITAMKWQAPPLPALDMAALLTVLLGMLGLGGLRSFEKRHGVNQNR